MAKTEGNRRARKPLSRSREYIFRVHRDDDGGVMLEPMAEDMMIHLNEGDELITGTLGVSPWKRRQ